MQSYAMEQDIIPIIVTIVCSTQPRAKKTSVDHSSTRSTTQRHFSAFSFTSTHASLLSRFNDIGYRVSRVPFPSSPAPAPIVVKDYRTHLASSVFSQPWRMEESFEGWS